MAVTTEQKSVASPSAAAEAMHVGVKMVRTLMCGTAAMRAAGKTYLPKNEAETEDAYKVRLARSVLFNATAKTVEDMSGKVFTKPIVLKKNVPAELVAYAEDIDLAGTHLNVFACEAFKDAMQSGVGYILTDAPPPVVVDNGRPPTKAETNAAGIRPYLTYIKVERLLGWKAARIAGVETLTQVRFLECVTETDGDFHEKEIEQVRVIEPLAWRTFRKNDKNEWAQVDAGVNRLGKITLAPFYLNRTGFMTGKPPLEKLADLNVAHWQLDSDLSNITHVAQVPILFMAGFQETDAVKVGAAEAVRSSNPDAKMTYVEHSGAAIGTGRERLKDFEFQMQAMGLQLLVDKPGQTATGETRDNVKENSTLAMMADALKDALERSLGFMAEYENLGADAGGEIEVNKDFGVQAGALGDMPNLIAMRAKGDITRNTLWSESQRRGFLSDSFNAEAEAGLLEKEAADNPGLDAGAGKGMNL